MNSTYATSLVAATLALLTTALPSAAASGDTLANARNATAIYTLPVPEPDATPDAHQIWQRVSPRVNPGARAAP